MADFVNADAIIGYKKKIEFSDTLMGTYVKLAGTININLPERELGTAETTNDDSPGFHKQYIPALYEPGTVTVSYRYGAPGFAAVETLFQLAAVASTRAAATKFWKVTLPDTTVAAFQGFVTRNNLPLEIEDSPECEFEIQVSGAMTYTDPA